MDHETGECEQVKKKREKEKKLPIKRARLNTNLIRGKKKLNKR